MKRTIYYMILCLLMSLGEIMAQGISGKVMDGKEQPIDGVAVILQTLDSVYVDAVVTDTLGDFRLNHPLDQSYRLIFQHILYNTELSVKKDRLLLLSVLTVKLLKVAYWQRKMANSLLSSL